MVSQRFRVTALILMIALAAVLGAGSLAAQPVLTAGMYVDQTPETVDVGDTFTTEVLVTLTPSAEAVQALSIAIVDEVFAHIDFDTSKLEVKSLTPGTVLPVVLQSQFDNSGPIGTIDYHARLGVPAVEAGQSAYEFLLVTIEFLARGRTTGTPLEFVFDPGAGRVTDIMSEGQTIIDRDQVIDGLVIAQSTLPAPNVPTVSMWGTAGLAVLLAGFMAWELRKRSANRPA